jgi:hypothetical protein
MVENMKESKITQSELYSELDKIRPIYAPEFTTEIYKYIQYARDNKSPVPWLVIVANIKKHFNIDIKLSTLRARYREWKNRT